MVWPQPLNRFSPGPRGLASELIHGRSRSSLLVSWVWTRTHFAGIFFGGKANFTQGSLEWTFFLSNCLSHNKWHLVGWTEPVFVLSWAPSGCTPLPYFYFLWRFGSAAACPSEWSTVETFTGPFHFGYFSFCLRLVSPSILIWLSSCRLLSWRLIFQALENLNLEMDNLPVKIRFLTVIFLKLG